MAITAVSVSSWSDVETFLAGMKDETNTNFFTNVVYDSSANTLSLYTTESGSDPMCVLSTAYGSINLKYFSNGSVIANKDTYYMASNAAPNFPFRVYKTAHGALFDITYSNNHYPLVVCKSSLGETTIICAVGYPLSQMIGTNQGATYYCGHNTKCIVDVSYSVPTFQINNTQASPHMDNRAYTALVPLPLFSDVPQYTNKAYINFFAQSRGIYGSFEYQGHTYLTNGWVSIFDT